MLKFFSEVVSLPRVPASIPVYKTLHEDAQHVQRHLVLTTFRQDEVGVLLGRLNEKVVHRLDASAVLVDDALRAPPALANVALQAPDEALVRRRVYEDAQREAFAQGRLVEDEHTLDDHHGRRVQLYRVRRAVVLREVVDGLLNALAAQKPVDLLDKQVGVEGARLVVVGALPRLEGEVTQRVVVGVLGQGDDALRPGCSRDRRAHRRFARARAARESDDERFARHYVGVAGSSAANPASRASR